MPKNRYKQLEKVFSIPLGAGDRAFEPRYSDQKPHRNYEFRWGFINAEVAC